MRLLNRTTFKFRFFRGDSSDINANLNTLGLEAEPLHATDSKQLYTHNGTEYKQIGLTRTSSAADPTTTELPNDGDACIHKNTSSGNIYLAFNNSGSIVKTQLT